MTTKDNKFEPREKLRSFQSRLKKEPNNGMLWVAYGDFLSTYYDDPEAVIEAYKKAEILLPDSASVRARLGSALVMSGKHRKGISVLRKSIKQKPTAANYCLLAEACLQNDKYVEARKACERALELEPSFEEAYYLLGEALKSNSKEEAITAYRKAVALDAKYQLAWQALGRELIGLPATRKEGISALRKAIRIDPTDGWARIFLANALWRVGQLKRADHQFKAAIKAFPDFKDFQKWYSQFLAAGDTNASDDYESPYP